MTKIDNINIAIEQFPKSIYEIKSKLKEAIDIANTELEVLYNINPENRSFDNTVRYFDILSSSFFAKISPLQVLEMVSPDEEIRCTAHQANLESNDFIVDNIAKNKKIYLAFNEYVQNSELKNLTNEELYTINQYMADFKRNGFDLDDDIQDKLRDLSKELCKYESIFDKNIAEVKRHITVSLEDLNGLSIYFIENLKKTDNGLYILGVDSSTYSRVLDNCSVESTRKNLWLEYNNRAYPENDRQLKKIIEIRSQISKLLGFKDYTSLDISNQMAHDPETVESFINNLTPKAQIKAKKEVELLLQDLPDGIALSDSFKFKPWDFSYIKNYYKKKHLQINEDEISEYFPLDSTLKALFDIYQGFFDITFNEIDSKNQFWHPDIKALEVYKNDQFIGHILLDLFPRECKYTHACQITINPTYKYKEVFYPALLLVIANFPKASASKPSLLNRDEVKVFFHEFGHAIHAILGSTELPGNSGTRVKTDFVEMPSQMLEEWLWQPSFLNKISRHYLTGKKLPEKLIEKILTLKNFDSGSLTLRQLYYASISLNVFKDKLNKNIHDLAKELFKKIINFVSYEEDSHFYCSFGHLTGYGAKYYGYLWSKVFALDLFETIRQNNFSSEIGKKYTDTIIGRGGSEDPENLLYNFLGRKTNPNAFIKDLGI